MAEQTEASPRGSVYMQETMQQASTDGGAQVSTPLSPTLPTLSAFGREFRLMCPICLQDLKQPRQLIPCYHIFCAKCVRPFTEKPKDGKIECPICKIKCPQEDISKALSSDTYLHAFQGHVSVYAESGNVLCSDPYHDQSVPAAYFCLECGKNFCDGCHSNHNSNDDFCNHHCLRLFKTQTTMTVGMNERESADAVDDGSSIKYKCPICRNTDRCEHEMWLGHLLQDQVREDNVCPIPEHKDGNKLIAYCTVCEEPICRNCSAIEHKSHQNTLNISNAGKEKLLELKALKKTLEFQQEMFADAAKSADKAENTFSFHIHQVQQEMMKRKGSMQTQVEEAFSIAFSLVEQTGRKQAELNKQSKEMHDEETFLNTAIRLAENALKEGTAPIEVVRVWKGLNLILKGLQGEREKKMEQNPEVVVPQQFEEKRLVLPAPNCMNPDLRILQKVGVEGTVLHRSFVLQAQHELLLFYSILPLTETEALVSCKTHACAAAEVVQYSNIIKQHYSVNLKDEGQYSIIAVPGKGIVATLYQAPGGCSGSEGKRQVLFWDQALDQSMTELEAKGAGNKLQKFAETDLPPRGVAVTRDNHLVVCTAEDPKKESGEGSKSCILLMTMRGDILRRKRMDSHVAEPSGNQYFPRYVTVNINGDICVTDEKDQSVIIFNGNLEEKIRIRNPYEKDELNRNFCPRGICHDSFGRLIIADANNLSVIRIELDDSYSQASLQPQVILKDGLGGVSDLSHPTLVAMGPGPKLWVVCRNNIQVFDYMDKE